LPGTNSLLHTMLIGSSITKYSVFAEYYFNHWSSRLEISKTRSRPPPELACAQTLVPAVFRFVNRFLTFPQGDFHNILHT